MPNFRFPGEFLSFNPSFAAEEGKGGPGGGASRGSGSGAAERVPAPASAPRLSGPHVRGECGGVGGRSWGVRSPPARCCRGTVSPSGQSGYRCSRLSPAGRSSVAFPVPGVWGLTGAWRLPFLRLRPRRAGFGWTPFAS